MNLRAVALASCYTRNEQQPYPEWLAVRLSRAVSAARRWNAITAPIRRMSEDTGIPAHELLSSLGV